ncbi:MAG: hypothetical protein EXR98_12695 [Gemmataceae bacterium]|nr:hypothetical protein [Gemmataceae bacterium]
MNAIAKLSWLLIPTMTLGLLAFTQAQTQPIVPATRVVPADSALAKPRDGSKLPESAQPIFFSASRAMDWLKLTNKPDGRFVYGFQPALRVQIDGDNFVSQAGATFALARASRYYRDGRGTAIAGQALLALLGSETIVEKDKVLRYLAAPPNAVDRLSAQGLLISAIHELLSPQERNDLLQAADELCNYLRAQQRPDGSLCVSVDSNLLRSGSEEIDAARAGWALQGIIRSQKHRPAAWKLDLLRKARSHYHGYWQNNKNLATVCSHAPAYAEAYAQTKDAAFAETVFAMNDWLISLQHRDEFDAARKHWAGGFPRFRDGKPDAGPPDIGSALAAESLAEACRVAKQAGDLPRLQRYERALLMDVHFLMSLQYTAKTTAHFEQFFRPSLLGAFHASHQDGSLRIDYTQHALCAMVQYLDTVVE